MIVDVKIAIPVFITLDVNDSYQFNEKEMTKIKARIFSAAEYSLEVGGQSWELQSLIGPKDSTNIMKEISRMLNGNPEIQEKGGD